MAEGFDNSHEPEDCVGEVETDANSSDECQPCAFIGRNRPAFGFCETCDELLCNSCFDAHCIPSVTRDHQLHRGVDKKARQRKSIVNKCEEHPGKTLEFYCEDHEQLGCSQCFVKKHRPCDKVVSIADVVVNETEEFKKFLNTFLKLGKSITANEEKIKLNMDIVRTQHAQAGTDMREAARKLISLIEKLLENQTAEEEQKTQASLKKLKRVEESNRDIKIKLETLMNLFLAEKGNNSQLFITMKYLQKELNVLETKLKESKQKNTVGEYVFTLQPELDRILWSLAEFGSLKNIKEVDIEKGTDEVMDLLEATYFQSVSHHKVYKRDMRRTLQITEELVVSTSRDVKLLSVLLTSNPYTNMILSIHEGEHRLAGCNKATPSDTPKVMDVEVLKSSGAHGVTLLAGHTYQIHLSADVHGLQFRGSMPHSSVIVNGIQIFFGLMNGPQNIFGIKFVAL